MVEIHADDYALTVNTSKEMLILMKDGVLDGISVIANNPCLDECKGYLLDAIPSLPFLPVMSVHLNLVEGLSLSGCMGTSSDSSQVFISETWASLFAASFIPFYRKKMKKALKAEIRSQIDDGKRFIDECIKKADASGVSCKQKALRIDGHQHTHMIPLVWSALVEVIDENGYDVEYIRNSKEPWQPFMNCAELAPTYRFANRVKNRLLNLLSGPVDRYCRKMGLRPMYLWGLMMSGRMDKDRVAKLYPSMLERAEADGRNLEILFHPGRMTDDEEYRGIPKKSADDFYLSAGRDIEKEGARCARSMADD